MDAAFVVISGEIICEQRALLTAIVDCLKTGTVPIVSLCSKKEDLPYSWALDWAKAAILVEKDNLNVRSLLFSFFYSPCIHYICMNWQDVLISLPSMDEKQLFELRRVGWLIADRYFSSPETFLDFAVAAVRDLVGLQPELHQMVRKGEGDLKLKIHQNSLKIIITTV